jgi:hypothetical protein
MPFREYTPAHTNSFFEEDEELEPPLFMKALRIVNDALHMLACVVLLLIMAFYLGSVPDALSRSTGPEAVLLVIFLGADVILDVFSAAQFRKPWPGWALFLRLFIGVAYISIFMVYVAIGRAFPVGYTYWYLPTGYATPIVYLFLWLIGVWDLLLTAIYRHQFGHELRRYFQAAVGASVGRSGRGHAQPAMSRRQGAADLEAGRTRGRSAAQADRRAAGRKLRGSDGKSSAATSVAPSARTSNSRSGAPEGDQGYDDFRAFV